MCSVGFEKNVYTEKLPLKFLKYTLKVKQQPVIIQAHCYSKEHQFLREAARK